MMADYTGYVSGQAGSFEIPANQYAVAKAYTGQFKVGWILNNGKRGFNGWFELQYRTDEAPPDAPAVNALDGINEINGKKYIISNSVAMQWNTPDDNGTVFKDFTYGPGPITGYMVYIDGQPSGSWITGNQYSLDTTGWTATGSHTFQVKARDFDGNESALSDPVVLYVDRAPPAAPGAPSTPNTAGFTNAATITWNWEPSSDADSGLKHYIVRVERGDGTPVAADVVSLVNSYSHAAETGCAYICSVKAIDRANNASALSPQGRVTADLTAPTIPGTPTTPAWVNTKTITFNWTAATDDLSGIKGYEVYVIENPGGAVKADWVFITGTSFSCTGSAEKNYSCKVRAVDTAGNRSPETPFSQACGIDQTMPSMPGTPTAPAWVNTTAGAFEWAAAGDDLSGVKGYEVYIVETPGGSVKADWAFTAATSYSITGAEGRSYACKVRAVDKANNRGPETPLSSSCGVDLTAPEVAGAPTVPAWINTATVAFDWAAAGDDLSGVKGYEVYIVETPGGSVKADWAFTAATSYSITGAEGKSYACKVRAVDNAGNRAETAYSPACGVDLTAPGAPGIPAAPAWVNTATVAFDWAAAGDDLSGVKGYEVYIVETPGGSVKADWDFTAATSYSITGIEGKSYACKVRAVDDAGNIGPETSYGPACGIDLTAPGAPGTPTAPDWVNTTSVTFGWTAASDVPSGVKGYEVYIVENPGGAAIAEWAFTSSTSYTVAGVEGRSYTCKARAVDNAGNIGPATALSPACGVDITAPTGSMSIDQDAPWTNSALVTLNLAAADAVSGVSRMCFSNDPVLYGYTPWEPYAATKSWILTEGDGSKTVFVKYMDISMNVVECSDTIVLDTVPPTGSISINNGDAYTNNLAVELTLNAGDPGGSGPAEMCFSNDGTAYSAWEAYAAEKSWPLAGSPDGPRTVYVRYRDNAGNESEAYSDGIEVDTMPPAIATNLDAVPYLPGQVEVLFAYDAERLAQSAPVVMAYDERSPLQALRYQWNPMDNNWSAWPEIAIQPGVTIPMPDGARSVSFYAVDQAENAKIYTFNCLVDGTPPTVGNVTLNLPRADGRYLAAGGIMPAQWAAQDDPGGSGLSTIKYAIVTGPVGSTEGFDTIPAAARAELGTANLLDGAVYYLAVACVDNLGNESAIAYSDLPILFDSSPPSLTNLNVTGCKTLGANLYFSAPSSLTATYEAADADSAVRTVTYALFENVRPATGWAAATDSIPTDGLVNGGVYSLAVRVENGTGLTAVQTGPPMVYDATCPQACRIVPDESVQRDRTRLSGSVSAVDFESGIMRYEIAIGTTAGGAEISLGHPQARDGWFCFDTGATGYSYSLDGLELADGTYHLSARAVNTVELASAAASVTVTIDGNLPARPLVRDDGDYAGSLTELHATWTFADKPAEKTVARYEYRILDASNTAIIGWTDAGSDTEAMATGLNLAQGAVYFFAVRAVYTDDTFSGEGRSNGITIDATPPVITAADDGDWAEIGGIWLRWAAHDGESGLRTVEAALGTTPGGTEASGWVPLTASPFFFGRDETGAALNLTHDRIYYLSIRTVNQAGLAAATRTDGVAIDSTPPAAPMVRDQGAWHNEKSPLIVSWNPAIDAESGILRYEVAVGTRPSPTGEENWIAVAADRTSYAYQDTLAHNACYYFFVRAVNGALARSTGASDGIAIDATQADTPIINDGTKNYYKSGETITVAFTAVDLETGVDRFDYAYGTADTVDTEPIRQSTGDFVESISADALPEGRIIIFKATAYNGVNAVSQPGYSDGLLVDRTPPSDFSVANEGTYVGEKVLRFRWTLPSSTSPLAGIRYAIVTDPGLVPPSNPIYEHDPCTPRLGAWVRLPGIVRTLQVADPSLVNGRTYYLLVTIADMAGNECMHASDGITLDVTPPGRPAVTLANGCWATRTLRGDITAGDPESGIAAYERALGSGRGAADLSPWQPASAAWEEAFPALQDGQAVYLSVRAINGAGIYSEPWMSPAIKIDLTAPSGTLLIDGGAAYTNSIDVSLTPSAEDPAGCGVARMCFSNDGEDFTEWEDYAPSKEWTLAAGDGTKTVRVKYMDALGNVSAALPGSIILDTTPPPVPVLQAAVKDDSARTVTVSWDPVSDPACPDAAPGSGVAGYAVQYRINGGAWVDAGLVGSTSWTKNGLTSADTIEFRVGAVDAAGNASPWSAATDVVCLAASAPIRIVSLTAQSNLVDNLPAYSVTVTAEPAADTAGYRYYRRDANGAVAALTPAGSASNVYVDAAGLKAHGVYEYGYSTYNALGEESAVVWADTSTSVEPGLLAPRVLIANIAPNVAVAGPPPGCTAISTGIGYTLGPARDAEGDALEYRLYARPGGSSDGGVLVCAWTPAADNPAVDALFAEGSHEWRICCIETDAGIFDRAETALTPWTPLAVDVYRPNPLCRDVYGELNVGTKMQLLAFDVEHDGTEPPGLTYEWSFGDGGSAVGKQSYHAYAALGSYVFTVTVADPAGNVYRKSQTVTIGNTRRGALCADEEWTGAHSILGNVIVPAGITLTIAPNTNVSIDTGCKLIVEGRLIATGGGVSFDRSALDWGGIEFTGDGSGNLDDVTISHAERGVACTSTGTISLTNVTFVGNKVGVHCYSGGITVTGSNFMDNAIYGIKEDNDCQPEVDLCTFQGNGMHYYDCALTELSEAELNTGANAGNVFVD